MDNDVVQSYIAVNDLAVAFKLNIYHHAVAGNIVSGSCVKDQIKLFRLKRSHKAFGSEVYAEHWRVGMVKIPCRMEHGAVAAYDDKERCLV